MIDTCDRLYTNLFEDMTSILSRMSAPEHLQTTSKVNALSALGVPSAYRARARSMDAASCRCFPVIALQRFAWSVTCGLFGIRRAAALCH